MRRAMLLFALLLTLGAPTGVAVLGACADTSAVTAVHFAWTPACIRVASGQVVTFQNADSVIHNARSSQDSFPTLRAVMPACFQTPDVFESWTAQVIFTSDAVGALAASVRHDDGSWGAPVDCRLAQDPAALATGDAGLAFQCGLHPSMTGRIVVARVAR